MHPPYSSPGNDVRLSDQERTAAMEALGRAFAEGRLTMDEYDQRCQQISMSQQRAELMPVFQDLPQSIHHESAVGPMYSAQEIYEAHRSGRRTRLGLMALTTAGTLAGAPLLIAAGGPGFAALYALIPIVFILLYIMKVGPANWYTPSPRKLERERMRQLRMYQAIESAEQRAAHEARQAQIRAQRQQLAGELTNEAMGFAKRSIEKLRK